MTDATYFEVIPSRNVEGSNFPMGVMDFSFSVGAPNAWVPSKSYFRIASTIYGAPSGGNPDRPLIREMVAFADNAVGNMFDNAYVRTNNVEISGIRQGLAQASALAARIGDGYAWLKSLGSGAELNKSSFTERSMFTSRDIEPDAYLKSANEIYHPSADGKFSDSEVEIDNTGSVTGTDTLFQTGMPSAETGASSGSTVKVGDVLVVDGIYYPITDVTAEDGAGALMVANLPSLAVASTPDWYIIRKDAMRAPQTNNKIFSLWRPPIGIFNYEDGLGSGEYRIQLNPNSNYLLTAIETKNPDYVASPDGTTGTYSLVVNEVKFYAYIEKMSIPDSIQDLSLMEYQVQSKLWSNNLQFSISPYTKAITIFVQDVTSGASPLCPPSMFKVLDNSDLKLTTLQVSYAGMTKPSTPWTSNFYDGTDQLQQRYRDTYEESGRVSKVDGSESYYDWLQRGPIYHFNFERDISNRATEVMLNTTFKGLPNGPGTSAIGGTGTARVFCISHYRRDVQITTAAGSIVNVTARNS